MLKTIPKFGRIARVPVRGMFPPLRKRFTDWLRGIAEREIPAWRRLIASYREEQAKQPKDCRLYFYRIHPDGTRTEGF